MIEAGRPTQPWGDAPPPAPAEVTRREIRAVRSAWSSWRHFRPHYTRIGDEVEAEIDLKDNVWRGRGRGATDEEAAWNALQACIAARRART
jgi:hypothetical protein